MKKVIYFRFPYSLVVNDKREEEKRSVISSRFRSVSHSVFYVINWIFFRSSLFVCWSICVFFIILVLVLFGVACFFLFSSLSFFIYIYCIVRIIKRPTMVNIQNNDLLLLLLYIYIYIAKRKRESCLDSLVCRLFHKE